MPKAGSTLTKGTRRVERGLSKASQRIGRSVELGLAAWRKRRSRSARDRRDGALRDVLQNSAFAAAKAAKEASWASSDFIRALGRRRDPRRVLLRALLPL
jgi:hypothetical protein